MTSKRTYMPTWVPCALVLALSTSFTPAASPKAGEAIPCSQVGAKAMADYKGDGLSVTPSESGARLRCVFQRLEGEAAPDGLWLTSTVTNKPSDRFRVRAAAVGRPSAAVPPLPVAGTVTATDHRVTFTRPGLLEEYSVSLDGVRQDFIVTQRPAGTGELQVQLEVAGARVEPALSGAQLVLPHSGRKIAYSRLRVTDAAGRELPARLRVGEEVTSLKPLQSENPNSQSPTGAPSGPSATCAPVPAVLVNDTDAVYPVRIDPTFSDANWISMSPSVPGADGDVYTMVVDGAGNLYIGGSFAVVKNVMANNIAKWDGSSWSALGAGVNDWVMALAVSGNDLYAGGMFTNAGGIAANRVAKWNGTGWSALGSGMNSSVYALAVSGGNVYAGGIFANAGGVAASCIAQWDGNSWSALGSGISGTYLPQVNALAVLGSELYAGGMFTNAGGVAATGIAKWTGSSWSALGLGMVDVTGSDPQVDVLEVSGSDLYAGGHFRMLTNSNGAGVTVNNIAKWDGSSWSALGGGITAGEVLALAVSGNAVYAGGSFTTATSSNGVTVSAMRVAKWDGSSWSALGTGTDARVSALAVFGKDLYAGGNFEAAGGNAAKRIARWDGERWSALGSGGNGIMRALAVSGGDVYAGGDFTTTGDKATNGIARWDGRSWTALGGGLGSGPAYLTLGVWALAVSGSDLYAGGNFLTVRNRDGTTVAANRIAKWNGSSWSALGAGMNSLVRALAVSGSNVYAGGDFMWVTNSGGMAVPVNRIAKWNGNSWSGLGLGLDGAVYALAVSGSNVYAGGTFWRATNSSGVAVTVYRVAKWNGSSWSALGTGLGSDVLALAVSGTNLYAGGKFYSPSGSYIAKWDGSSWRTLGSGMNKNVYALAASGSDLYAGGQFTTAGGSPANYIAKWNGSAWSVLGSGFGGAEPCVFALAVSEGELFAGGSFTKAGGKISAYAARAVLGGGKLLPLQVGVPGPRTNTLTFAGIPDNEYFIQFATNLTTSPWFTLSTNTAGADGFGTVKDPAATNAQRFYRLSMP